MRDNEGEMVRTDNRGSRERGSKRDGANNLMRIDLERFDRVCAAGVDDPH